MATATRSLNSQATQRLSRMATVALAGIVYFVLIVAALHFLQPDLNPLSQTTSEYAIGPYGFLMTSAFFSMSLSSWALVIGLYQGVAQLARSRIGLGLMGVWATGVLVAMLFPIDPQDAPQTLAGTIHAINGPVDFLSLTLGVFLVSRRFKNDEAWRPVYRSALVLALLMLVEFVGVPLALATGSGLAGLAQRVFLVTFATWFCLAAGRLRSIAVETD
jgi:hypothetical protein